MTHQDVNRRGFLGKLAVAAGGLLGVAVLGRPAEARSRRRYGWGGYGYGRRSGSRGRFWGPRYGYGNGGYGNGYGGYGSGWGGPRFLGPPVYGGPGYYAPPPPPAYYGAPRGYYLPMMNRMPAGGDALRLLEA